MEIAIRKEPNGSMYIDANALNRFDKNELVKPPYNYSFVEVPYTDVQGSDFNEDLSFNIEKYNARKNCITNEARIVVIQKRLQELSQDFIQVQCGAVFEDIEERKLEFQTLHNELRQLQGKQPRLYEEASLTNEESN